jgi:hypothetical protein
MDVHVAAAITAGLRRRGVDVLTAQEDNTGELEDTLLLERAAELGRVLFTHDKDFLTIAAQRQQSDVPFAGVIFSPQVKARIGSLVNDLELIACCSGEEEVRDRVTYLPFGSTR